MKWVMTHLFVGGSVGAVCWSIFCSPTPTARSSVSTGLKHVDLETASLIPGDLPSAPAWLFLNRVAVTVLHTAFLWDTLQAKKVPRLNASHS